ncbi:unnamed protein product, partial [Rotaria magnacalcarata]
FELAAGIGLGIIVLAIFFRGSICFPIGKHFGLDWLLFLFCLLIDVAIRLGLRLGLCVGIDIALDLLIDVFIADIGTVINLNIRNIDIISDIRVLFRFGIGINIIHTGICFRLGIGFVDIVLLSMILFSVLLSIIVKALTLVALLVSVLCIVGIGSHRPAALGMLPSPVNNP